MGISDYIIPVLYGGVAIFLIFWVFYVFYWVLNSLGILKLAKKMYGPKVPDEIYLVVADKISKGRTFEEIFQETSNDPKKVQEQYIQAYTEIKNIQMKGGAKR